VGFFNKLLEKARLGPSTTLGVKRRPLQRKGAPVWGVFFVFSQAEWQVSLNFDAFCHDQ